MWSQYGFNNYHCMFSPLEDWNGFMVGKTWSIPPIPRKGLSLIRWMATSQCQLLYYPEGCYLAAGFRMWSISWISPKIVIAVHVIALLSQFEQLSVSELPFLMATPVLCMASSSSCPSISRTQHKDSEHFWCDIMYVGVWQESIFRTHLREERGRRALQTRFW